LRKLNEIMAEENYTNELDADFWNARWLHDQTGWDVGQASPPIMTFMQDFPQHDAKILIPGCGNAYEAEALVELGFTSITLLDISEEAVRRLKEKYRHLPQIKVLQGNFFEHDGTYDLIIEQTFFCAQVLERREEYVKKMQELLTPKGKLIGVLFNRDFGPIGPPFGGNEAEYRSLFEPFFAIHKMEPCYNSIRPRAGSELFIHLIRK